MGGSSLNLVFSPVDLGVIDMSSMNLAWEFFSDVEATDLLLVKLSGLIAVQLLNNITNASAGRSCLTITSFVLG
jgi:hypothetical protein